MRVIFATLMLLLLPVSGSEFDNALFSTETKASPPVEKITDRAPSQDDSASSVTGTQSPAKDAPSAEREDNASKAKEQTGEQQQGADADKPSGEKAAEVALSHEELCTTIVASAQQHDIPVAFFSNLIWQESRFNHKAVSPVGAQGVAQFMPYVAESVGLEDPFDARQALPASARLLRDLFRQFDGNAGLAAAAYNAGPKRVIDWMKKRKATLPKETRDYVLTITGRPADKWRATNPLPVAYDAAPRMPCKRLESFARVEHEERKEALAEIAVAEREAVILAAAKAAQTPKKNARAVLLAAKKGPYLVAASSPAADDKEPARKASKETKTPEKARAKATTRETKIAGKAALPGSKTGVKSKTAQITISAAKAKRKREESKAAPEKNTASDKKAPDKTPKGKLADTAKGKKGA